MITAKGVKLSHFYHLLPQNAIFQTGSEFSSFVSSSLESFFEFLYNIFFTIYCSQNFF